MSEQPQTGSWWGLDAVFKQSQQEFDAYWSRPPADCPQCAEPLTPGPSTPRGATVQLFCRYDGWQYPRDWHPPTRPATGMGAGAGGLT